MRNLMIVLVVFAVGVGSVFGYVHDDYTAGDFKHICWEHNPIGDSETVENSMDYTGFPIYDEVNLEIRTDPNDASGDSDEIVSKIGSSIGAPDYFEWYGEKWEIAFISHYYGGDRFGGYANNNNSISTTARFITKSR